MLRKTLLFVFMSAIFHAHLRGQKSFLELSDTLNKKRLTGIGIATGTTWAGSMTALYTVWYGKQELSGFHAYDDSRSWLQMDKLGHVYTAWKINDLSSSMFRWTGLDRKRSLLVGSSVAWGYQATLEVFDGLSEDWGFSWADLASNTVGVLGYASQELLWKEQRLIPKFSYRPTEFAAYRPEVLGGNFTESLLKDYNGQSYWLSISPGNFMDEGKFPNWLCFSIGYSAHERLYGDEDQAILSLGGENRSFDSSREWLFSLDLDLSRIPVKKKWASLILKQLNHLKVPFPAIVFREGKLYGKALYF
jgi:hypothetical protein